MASAAVTSTTAAKSAGDKGTAKAADLGLLEEDDDFEEFPGKYVSTRSGCRCRDCGAFIED